MAIPRTAEISLLSSLLSSVDLLINTICMSLATGLHKMLQVTWHKTVTNYRWYMTS